MHRSIHTIGLAVALLLAGCTKREPTSHPSTPDTPPTFVEAEPSEGAVDASGLTRLTIAFPEGLLIEMHAEPVALGGGTWGFEIDLEVYNRLGSGAFYLGREPLVIFSVSVRLPDGSGFGTGGGCVYGSRPHGSKEDQALEPGKRYNSRQRWTSGLEAGQVLEVGIRLCRVELPDGRELSGDIAELEATVDGDGKLARFELHTVSLPQPK